MPIQDSLPTRQIPSIFDRADGVTPGAGGIEEAPGSVLVNSAGGVGAFFYETSDSPEVESAEQSTIVHKFHCDYDTAQIYMLTNPRGTYLTDQYGDVSRVLSTKISPIPHTGVRAVVLTVTSEGQYPLFPNPPDEFDIETVEINPVASKHPRYAIMTYNQKWFVRQAANTDNLDQTNNYINQISKPIGPTNKLYPASAPVGTSQQSASLELLYKQFKGEDTFYMAGYKVTWSQYYWYPQYLNPGGYIEDPVYGGGLPAYFWSDNGLPTGHNIFAETTTYNQNMYPQPTLNPPYGLSWLRQADTIHLQRTWWRLTRSWVGAPLGHWDNEWYNKATQLYQASIDQGSVVNGSTA